MRIYLPFLFFLLFLQGCMPDSFTKFREEPAEKAAPSSSGGSGSGGGSDPDANILCPAGSHLTDIMCLNPRFVIVNPEDDRLLIFPPVGDQRRVNTISQRLDLNSLISFDPIYFGLADITYTPFFEINPEFFPILNDITTFTKNTAPAPIYNVDGNPASGQIQPIDIIASLPEGLSFSTETGTIAGQLDNFFPPLTFNVSAQYDGHTPRVLSNSSERAIVNFQIFSEILPNGNFTLPVGEIAAVTVDQNIDDFAVGSPISFSGSQSVSATITGIVPDDNRIFFVIPENLRIQIGETAVSNTSNFVSELATVSDYYVALKTNTPLARDPENTRTIAPKISDFRGETLIIDEKYFYDFFLTSPATTPAGLQILQRNTCDLPDCFSGPAASSPYYPDFRCTNKLNCLSTGRRWLQGGTIVGTPTNFSSVATYQIETENRRDGQVATSSIRFGVFNQPQSIAFDQNNMKLRLSVESTSPFAPNQWISNNRGARARVLEVNSTDQSILVQVDNPAGSERAIFKNADQIDNAHPFFAPETSISSAPIYIIDEDYGGDFLLRIGRNAQMTTVASTITDPTELASYTYEMSPNISLGIPGLSFDTATGHIVGTPDPNASPLSPTTFTVVATSPGGIRLELDTPIEFIGAPTPGRFILAKDMLLQVPSNTNFRVGDFISSNDPALPGFGHVRDRFTYDGQNFIWIHVVSGNFRAGNNIDNTRRYLKQSGNIAQALPINAVIELNSAADLSSVVGELQKSSLQEATIVAQTNDSNTATVIAKRIDGSIRNLYVAIDNGSFITGSSVNLAPANPGDPLGASLGTIDNINGHIIDVQFNSSINALAHLDIDVVQGANHTTNPLGVGFIRSYSGNRAIVEVLNGKFNRLAAESAYFANPIPSAPPAGSSRTVSFVRTVSDQFIAHKNRDFSVSPFTYGNIPSDFRFSIAPQLPPGLELNDQTGRIFGTPTDRSDPIVYTISGSDGREYQFTLEVKDYYELRLVNAPSSYILHQAGMGKGRQPCQVSREAFETGSVTSRDITCYLDASEAELYANGVDFNLDFGGDMCQIVEYLPYTFFQYPAGIVDASNSSHREITQRIGACTPVGEPAFVRTGTSSDIVTVPGVHPANGSYQIDSFMSACWFNYQFRNDIDWAPDLNCDGGTIIATIEEYPVVQSCLGDTTLTQSQCYDANGACFDVNDPDDVQPAPAFTNRADCEAQPEHEWEPDTSAWGDFCPTTPTAGWPIITAVEELSCGGAPEMCMSGPGKEEGLSLDEVLSNEGLLFSTLGDEGTLPFSVEAPSTMGFRGNTYASNFIHQNSCVDLGQPFRYGLNSWEARSLIDRGNAADDIGDGDFITTNPLLGIPTYTFLCQDGSGDTLSRIRLLVREWDRGYRVPDNIDRIFFTNNGNIRIPAYTAENGVNTDKLFGATYRVERDEFNQYVNRRSTWDDMPYIAGDDPLTFFPNYSCSITGSGAATLTGDPYPFPLDDL